MFELDQVVALLDRSRLDLRVTEFVEDIEGGEFEEIEDVWFLCFRKSGVSFRFDDDALTNVVFYLRGSPKGGFVPYSGALAHGLQPSLRREQITERLGDPLVAKPAWALYRFDDHVLHLLFGEGGDIQDLTVMSLNSKAARFHLDRAKK